MARNITGKRTPKGSTYSIEEAPPDDRLYKSGYVVGMTRLPRSKPATPRKRDGEEPATD